MVMGSIYSNQLEVRAVVYVARVCIIWMPRCTKPTPSAKRVGDPGRVGDSQWR